MKKILTVITLLSLVLFAYDFGKIPQIKVKDIPTNEARMVMVGKTVCIWCESMAPQLKEIKEEYPQTNIYYVNSDHDIMWTLEQNISELPVQIFYDAEGKEIGRNLGYLGKDDLLALLKESGVLVE